MLTAPKLLPYLEYGNTTVLGQPIVFVSASSDLNTSGLSADCADLAVEEHTLCQETGSGDTARRAHQVEAA